MTALHLNSTPRSGVTGQTRRGGTGWVLGVLLLAASSGAVDTSPCQELLRRRPPLLQVQSNIQNLPEEIEATGRRLGPSESFTPLETGTHLYLILDDGTIWSSPRLADSATPSRYLATHRALFQKARQSDSNANVIAAGEFEIADGKCLWINNRSGTFRGGTDSLIAAKSILSDRGLAFSTNTAVRDFSAHPELASMNHLQAQAQARLLLQFRGTPVLRALEDFYTQLSRRFPPTPSLQGGLAYDGEQAADRYNQWLDSAFDSGEAFAPEFEQKWLGAIDILMGMPREGIPYALKMIENAPSVETLVLSGDLQRLILGP